VSIQLSFRIDPVLFQEARGGAWAQVTKYKPVRAYNPCFTETGEPLPAATTAAAMTMTTTTTTTVSASEKNIDQRGGEVDGEQEARANQNSEA